jgi:tetratricopeptide (TPR) repeat protein
MTEERLFELAVQASPAERAALLDRECAGNPELRARVEALLAADAQSDVTIDSPVNQTASFAESGGETGAVIAGRYTLVESIGEGGMGEVWVAKQSEPVKRKVALKLIKAGMDSKAVLQRFEQERQALALMDHPNIAKVLDGGLTAERRPFFVMELVIGLPLTKFCDEAKLGVRERLELFVPICQAVQHAHQKGIIHRDLKPSNVLVTIVDGRGVPKIIDFGVAKATSGRLTDESLSTQFGAVVGTLEYMSPEQAGFSGEDIDTRADIYSLGVILYELLTGLRPLDAKRLRQAAMTEMIRIIKEEEPSTRISTDDSAPSLAALRHTEPKKLAALLRGELDWVVMKCLEKQRDRRYDTANGLARDIQRYLADEVVEARPPSAGYRLRKFARKRRAALASAAAIASLLVVGLSASLWQMNRAIAAERDAEEKRKAAVAEADLANGVKTFLQKDVLQLADPATQQQEGAALKYDADVRLRDVVLRAAERIEGKFTDRPLVEADIRHTLGYTLLGMGRADLAAEQMKRALELRRRHLGPDDPDTLKCMVLLGRTYFNLGRHPDAVKLIEETLPLQKTKLGPDHPETLSSMGNLALYYGALGRYAEELKLNEETLALRKAKLGPDHPSTLMSMSNLANSYASLGRNAEALKLREEVLALRKAKLGADHPETLRSMNNLAASYHSLGRYDEAARLNEETLAIRKAKLGPDHPDTIWSMNNLAAAYIDMGRPAEALKLYEETFALRRAKLGPDHPDTLGSMDGLAVGYANLGRHAEALKLREETLALRRAKLGPDHPDTLGSMSSLAVGYSSLGRHAEALKLREETLALRKANRGPDHPDTLRSMSSLAESYAALGRHTQALKLREETLALRKVKLGSDHPNTLWSMHCLTESYADLGRNAEALKLREETLALGKAKLGVDNPNTHLSMDSLAESYAALGRHAEALKLREEVLALRKAKLGPDHPDTYWSVQSVAESFAALGRRSEAQGAIRKVIQHLESLPQKEQEQYDEAVSLARAYCGLGASVRDAGQPATALPWFDKGQAPLDRALEKEPQDAAARKYLRNIHEERAIALEQLKRPAEADADWAKAFNLSPDHEKEKVKAKQAEWKAKRPPASTKDRAP